MLESPENSPPKKTRKQNVAREPLSALKDSTLNARRAINDIDLNISSLVDFGDKKEARPGVFAKPTWKSTMGCVEKKVWFVQYTILLFLSLCHCAT